jgi:DGQHR domain-containing protein
MAQVPSNWLSYDAIEVVQGKKRFYFFRAAAADLRSTFDVQLHDDDTGEGYQRHFSASRVRSIAKFIKDGHAIPLSILVTLDRGAFEKGRVSFPKKKRTGWIIDGQHRFLGALEAGGTYQLPFLAFVNLDQNEQINQFVTINREARGVPSSLYYALLPNLRDRRTPTVAAKEQAGAIAEMLRKDEASCYYGRIVVTHAPAKGQLSLNNFVRKVHPLLIRDRGILATYSELQNASIIDNYYKGLQAVFPKEYAKTNSKFFQTLGFGALINALPTFFSVCLAQHREFTPQAVARTFKLIDHFDFDAWGGIGTGSQAERNAGEDLVSDLNAAVAAVDPSGGSLKLK